MYIYIYIYIYICIYTYRRNKPSGFNLKEVDIR